MVLEPALSHRTRPVTVELPCRTHDPNLWFADAPDELERAKALCSGCPARAECFALASAQKPACGVWGGEIFVAGSIVARKRPRGRPRKSAA